jgi:hypothetical protein
MNRRPRFRPPRFAPDPAAHVWSEGGGGPTKPVFCKRCGVQGSWDDSPYRKCWVLPIGTRCPGVKAA